MSSLLCEKINMSVIKVEIFYNPVFSIFRFSVSINYFRKITKNIYLFAFKILQIIQYSELKLHPQAYIKKIRKKRMVCGRRTETIILLSECCNTLLDDPTRLQYIHHCNRLFCAIMLITKWQIIRSIQNFSLYMPHCSLSGFFFIVTK